MDAAISSAYRRLRIPDAERYWVEQVKCRVGCPVFTAHTSRQSAEATKDAMRAYIP